MPTPVSPGTCQLCGKTFGRAAMTRHLSVCGTPPSAGSPSFHLVVEGRYARSYWMHLAIPVKAALGELDAYLRRIWLECCGHLSAFTIGPLRYSYEPMAEYGEKGLRASLNRVLEVGTKFSYEYDFGSTTELNLRVVALRSDRSGEVDLLARNDPPEIDCEACESGKPATQICTECACSGKGWLCKDCAADHRCDSEMFLPVVNSPRVGVCGYCG